MTQSQQGKPKSRRNILIVVGIGLILCLCVSSLSFYLLFNDSDNLRNRAKRLVLDDIRETCPTLYDECSEIQITDFQELSITSE